MNFQFYCPQGHLLQADTAHAGSAIVCPVCGMQFIIPAPPPQVAAVVTPVVSPAAPASNADEADSLNFGASKRGRNAGKKGPDLNAVLGGAESPAREFAPQNEEEDEASEASPFAMMSEKKIREKKAEAHAQTQAVLNQATKRKKKAEELDLLHIPCPKGHILDVDKEMLGERVQCPVCHAVYDLKLENSLEYIQEKRHEMELEEARMGKVWIVRAVIATVILILFLGVLIFS